MNLKEIRNWAVEHELNEIASNLAKNEFSINSGKGGPSIIFKFDEQRLEINKVTLNSEDLKFLSKTLEEGIN